MPTSVGVLSTITANDIICLIGRKFVDTGDYTCTCTGTCFIVSDCFTLQYS